MTSRVDKIVFKIVSNFLCITVKLFFLKSAAPSPLPPLLPQEPSTTSKRSKKETNASAASGAAAKNAGQRQPDQLSIFQSGATVTFANSKRSILVSDSSQLQRARSPFDCTDCLVNCTNQKGLSSHRNHCKAYKVFTTLQFLYGAKRVRLFCIFSFANRRPLQQRVVISPSYHLRRPSMPPLSGRTSKASVLSCFHAQIC